MTQTVTEQKGSIDRRALAHGVPDPQGDLGVSGAGHDQDRWTGNEPGTAHESGLVVAVWLLAALIAEVEVFWWVLTRLYEH